MSWLKGGICQAAGLLRGDRSRPTYAVRREVRERRLVPKSRRSAGINPLGWRLNCSKSREFVTLGRPKSIILRLPYSSS